MEENSGKANVLNKTEKPVRRSAPLLNTVLFNQRLSLFVLGLCKDTNEREGPYCGIWKAAGLCDQHKIDMKHICRETCNLCE